MSDALQQTWQAIAADNLSGASEIYSRVLKALMQQLALLDQTQKALRDDWPQCLRGMLHAQPMMAPLYSLANQLALIFEQEGLSESERMTQALFFLQQEERQAAQNNIAIAQHAFSLIADKPRVLAHSYSGTVAAALEHAQRNGIAVEVYLSEGRPANEGRRMAERLARAGVPVHFFVDDARAHFIHRVDLVVLGADRIAGNFFLNKIGTHGLVLLASQQKIPVALLAARNKLWPANLPFGEESFHPPSEIWQLAPPSIQLHNFYFEKIELDLVQKVFTEKGFFSQQEFRRFIQDFRAAQFWRHVFSG